MLGLRNSAAWIWIKEGMDVDADDAGEADEADVGAQGAKDKMGYS